jgi:hypothetical protein
MRAIKVTLYSLAAAVIIAAMIFARASGHYFSPLLNKEILTLSAVLMETATAINLVQKRKNKDALYTSSGIVVGLFLIVLWCWISL